MPRDIRVLVVVTGMMALLAEGSGSESAPLRCFPADSDPPEPAALLLGQHALPLAQLLAQLGAPLVFLFPELGAVVVPVLAELGREGLGEEEEPDVVAARTEVFLHEAGFVVHAVVRLVVLPTTDALVGRRAFDVVEIAGGRREERGREGEQKGQVGKQFLPPRAPDHDDLGVHVAKTTVGNGEPAPWPTDPPFPLSRAPDQQCGHHSAQQRDFLAHLDHPVD